MDEVHIKAAVNDILGKPIVIGTRTFDHLQEVKNALKGLGNQIGELDKLIKGGKASDEVLDAAKQLRSQFQKQKDEITDVLNRAEKKAQE